VHLEAARGDDPTSVLVVVAVGVRDDSHPIVLGAGPAADLPDEPVSFDPGRTGPDEPLSDELDERFVPPHVLALVADDGVAALDHLRRAGHGLELELTVLGPRCFERVAVSSAHSVGVPEHESLTGALDIG
jgi:hypothetical protein